MEAVPRLPMISCELKVSPNNTEFGPVLKKFIREHYHEDPEIYNKEIKELETLRHSACNAPHDYTGCSILKRYYSQLHFLQSRFPMTDDGAACVAFTWTDIYSGMVFNITDIVYEQACILYNIGALHAKLGAFDSRNSPEGMKIACTHFQCSAWAFQHLRDTYPQPRGSDMSHDILTFFVNVLLAQAQECILEKSMLDSRKSSITAKIATQVVDYYKSAVGVLVSGSPNLDSGSILDIVGSSMFKRWKKFIEFKMAYYNSISHLYMGNQAEEQQKMGERVAWYQSAFELLNEAIKLSKNVDRDDLGEALTFTMDVIGGKHSSSKKENDFVYHEKVPSVDSLPELRGASLVKGIPFNHTDTDVCGQDIFARLVPMEAHEASSLYRIITELLRFSWEQFNISEEKAKILRSVSAMLEEKNQEVTTYLSSLQVDDGLFREEHEEIPQELLERCAAMSVKSTVISDLTEIMNGLVKTSHEVEDALNMAHTHLLEEEQSESKHQEIFGKRIPSLIIVELNKECSKYEEAHKKALESNKTLQNAVNIHLDNLKILANPLEDVLKSLPSLPSSKKISEEPPGRDFKQMLAKVEEMRQQRISLEQQLRSALQNDDITDLLVTVDKKGDVKKIFAEELKKHDQILSYLDLNLKAQDNILCELTRANALFADTRKSIAEAKKQRESMISSLIHSFDAYEDLKLKAQKGLEFYEKLQCSVTRLLARVRSVIHVQEDERTQISQAQMKKAVVPSQIRSPSKESSTPKLKDFLPFMSSHSAQLSPSGQLPPGDMNYPHVPPSGAQLSHIYQPRVTATPGPDSSLQQHVLSSSKNFNDDSQTMVKRNDMLSEDKLEPISMGIRPTPLGSEQTITAVCTPATLYSGKITNYSTSLSNGQQWNTEMGKNQHNYPTVYAASHFPASNVEQHAISKFPIVSESVNISSQVNHYPPSGPTSYVATNQMPFQTYVQPAESMISNSENYPINFPSTSINSGYSSNNTNAVSQNYCTTTSVPLTHTVSSPMPATVPSGAIYNQSQQATSFSRYASDTSCSNSFISYPGVYQREANSPNISMPQSYYSYPSVSSPEMYQLYCNYQKPSSQQSTVTTYSLPLSSTQYSMSSSLSSSNMDYSYCSSYWTHMYPYSQSQSSASVIVPATSYTQPTEQPVSNYAWSYSAPLNSVPQIQNCPQSWEQPNQNLGVTTAPVGLVGSQLSVAAFVPPEQLIIPSQRNLTPVTEKNIPNENMQSPSALKKQEVSNQNAIPIPSTNVLPVAKSDLLSSPSEQISQELNSKVLKPKIVEVKSVVMPKEKGLTHVVKDPLADQTVREKFVLEVEKYEKLVDGLLRKSLNGTTPLDQKWKEFTDTQDKESRKMSISVARCCPLKNRYPDIMPYDNNRVKLGTAKDDYINASYLKDLFPNSPVFVVTQAPLPATYNDFWVMIWEQQVETLVCLLSQSELKNHVYWPKERGQNMQFGSLTVSLQSVKEKICYVEHVINLANAENRTSRVVVHLQFTSWPSNGVPSSPSQFLQFITEVLNYQKQQRNLLRPVVVHCSGGVGRSGVFCLVIAVVTDMITGHGPADVAQVAARMSQQRKFLIQDKDQLKFCYDAVLYYAQDLLMKRGILTNKASFDDKLPGSSGIMSHTRHPSEDFILGSGGLAKLQSGMEKMGLADQCNIDPMQNGGNLCSKEEQGDTVKSDSSCEAIQVLNNTSMEDVHSGASGKPEKLHYHESESEPLTAMSDNSQSSITSLLDPSNFTLDVISSPVKRRITKDNFANPTSSLANISTDNSDPFSQLDPLWSLKKSKS